MKTKLAVSVLLAVFAALPLAVVADATITFPKDDAGMAAYVKLNQLSQVNFDNACQSLFENAAPSGQTYMIGTKNYSATDDGTNKVEFHIYLGTDGWLVVYLLRNQNPSRIVNWQSGHPLSETLLKIATEDAIDKIGASVAETMKYYDFSNPDATKMTLIRETVEPGQTADDFSVTVPGNLYRASYSLASFGGAYNSQTVFASLYMDNNQFVDKITDTPIIWGDYDESIFTAQTSHTVILNKRNDNTTARVTTLLFYKPI